MSNEFKNKAYHILLISFYVEIVSLHFLNHTFYLAMDVIQHVGWSQQILSSPGEENFRSDKDKEENKRISGNYKMAQLHDCSYLSDRG